MPATVSVRKLAILALLAAQDSRGRSAQPIYGVTRLQKLLFLVQSRLGRVSGARQLNVDFAFVPEKFGPADLDVYPDLEFLEALGHVIRRPNDEDLLGDTGTAPSLPELGEAALSYEYLMGDETDAGDLALAEHRAERFQITDRGLRALGRILESLDARGRPVAELVVDQCGQVRAEFGDWPLARLLRYVYSNFPEMTTRSEIKDRVLGYE
jgi:hypothetical protein